MGGRHVILLALALACSSEALEKEAGGGLAQKLVAVRRLWEFQPDEFRTVTRLDAAERLTLASAATLVTSPPPGRRERLVAASNKLPADSDG